MRFLEGFGILILIWIWSLVFDMPLFKFFSPYLDFENADGDVGFWRTLEAPDLVMAS